MSEARLLLLGFCIIQALNTCFISAMMVVAWKKLDLIFDMLNKKGMYNSEWQRKKSMEESE